MGMCSNDLSSTNLFNSRAPALRTIPAYCGYQDLCCKRHAPGKEICPQVRLGISRFIPASWISTAVLSLSSSKPVRLPLHSIS